MIVKTVPPCQAACPIHTDVCGYVSAIARGDVEEAIRIIRQVNPLPSVCGRICTRVCEKACRRAQVDEPVSIRALKRFASDQTRNLDLTKKPQNSYEEKVAVVGGGPAGLTAAHDLASLGYRVAIFEKRNVLGGLLSEGIPEYRLPKKLVQEEINSIVSLGIKVKAGLSLGKDFTLEGLLEDHQAVFLSVGSQKSLLPECQGSGLPCVISGVDFLKQAGKGEAPPLGKHVLVIGGGHTAIDAARTCIRLGCPEVILAYRRTLDEMPAGREEVEVAEREGIKMMYLISPVEFIGEGKVQSVKLVKMELEEPDASGRRRPVPVVNSEFELRADTVISAIGYMPDAEALVRSGLSITKKGTIIVQDDTGLTNIKGVFAAGDVVTGPLSVIEAMASAKRAAEAIHHYFRDEKYTRDDVTALQSLDENVIKRIRKSERQKMPSLAVEDSVNNFAEVDLGFTREEACREALRCLNCGTGASVAETCAACLNCVRICPFGVPVPGKEIAEIDISQCQACGICVSECPASAISLNREGKEDLRKALKQIIDFTRLEKPDMLIIGFYCRYGSPLGPPVDGDEVYWIGRWCTGSLKESQILYPFEMGAEGVVVHMCGFDECRFGDGSRWLTEHIKRAKRILSETGIGEDRLAPISGDEDFTQFRQRLDALGINPLRTGKKVES